MSRKILGLDIRNDSVTAVMVLNAINGNQVAAAYHIIKDAGQPDDQKDTFLSRAIKEVSSRIDLSGCTVMVSYPANNLFFRNVSIPFKNQKKIKQVLPFELEPTLPLPVEELEIAFQPIRLNDDERLIAAAVEKSKMGSLMDTLKSHQITPDMVTISGYPMAKNLFDSDKNGIFLDVDTHDVSIGLCSAGQVCVYRNTPINLDLADGPESMLKMIRQTLTAFHETWQYDFKPEALFMTGKGLASRELQKELEANLNIPVNVTDIKTLYTVDIPQTISWQPEIMDNSLVLAMLDVSGIDTINFSERPFAGKKIITEYKEKFIRTGILFLSLLVIALISFFIDMTLMSRKITTLDTEIKKVFLSVFPDRTRIQNPVDELQIAVSNLNKDKLSSTKDNEKQLAIDILNKISKKISKTVDVEVSQLIIGADGVQLAGETDSFNSVDEMKNSLETIDTFSGVKINSATIDKTTKRIRFKIKISL
ncbi:MAG: hypothetical protein KJ737_24370 [Proteobacteria bacterium]|nr:hypothetical protein [Pseudomonadota bacterium]